MRNLLTLICAIAILLVCWMMLREMKVYQEQIDVLMAKIEVLDSVVHTVGEDVPNKSKKVRTQVLPEKTKPVKKAEPKEQKVEKVAETKIEQIVETKQQEPQEQKVVSKDDIVITQYKKDFVDKEEIITFKNNTAENINKIKGIIVYKDLSGNDISYQELNIRISIAPGMSKQTKIRSFDQDNKYVYYKEFKSYMEVSSITPFKFEFRLISYN